MRGKERLELLTRAEAADYLGVSAWTLWYWRRQGRGPAFLKIGSRKVRYNLPDLKAWLQGCRVQPAESKRRDL